MHRLWEHPEQQRAGVVADRSLLPEAYREVLRFDMPTQFLMRRVVREVSLHGQRVRPGQNVAFLYPSANRDPREFEEPDRFDVRRAPPRILSFGHGIHACIGQHFATRRGAPVPDEAARPRARVRGAGRAAAAHQDRVRAGLGVDADRLR